MDARSLAALSVAIGHDLPGALEELMLARERAAMRAEDAQSRLAVRERHFMHILVLIRRELVAAIDTNDLRAGWRAALGAAGNAFHGLMTVRLHRHEIEDTD